MSAKWNESEQRESAQYLLSGGGQFVGDLVDDALHVCFVRSVLAGARIRSVDVGSARGREGVIAILQAEDLGLADAYLPFMHVPHPTFVEATEFSMVDPGLPVLATRRTLYVGQPIAVVVATTRAIAEDAVEDIYVDYDEDAVVVDPLRALEAAPLVHDHLATNQAARLKVEVGDVAAARREAAFQVSGTYRVGRQGAVPLEARGVVARHRGSTIELAASTQLPHRLRDGICEIAGWSTDDLRVWAPHVGGAFGVKAAVSSEEVVVTIAAKVLGRDLAWIEDRREHLIAAAQSRDQIHQTRISLDESGKILAWEDDFVVDIGVGSQWVAGILSNTATHLFGPYLLENVRLLGRAAFTNKVLSTQYRGAGRPEACFALERSVDQAAVAAGMPPEHIRRLNILSRRHLPRPVGIPYRDGVPISLDGYDYEDCLERALSELPRSEKDIQAQLHPRLAIGYGIAAYIESTGRGPFEGGRVTLGEDGTFTIAAGSVDSGQGITTTLRQVAGDVLLLPPSEIRVLNGDTRAIEQGTGSYASRSMILAGSAVHIAATELVEDARQYASLLLGVDWGAVDFSSQGFSTPGSDPVTWEDLAEALSPNGHLEGSKPLDVVHYFSPETVTWTMGAHVAIVGVDRESGITTVLKYLVVHEGGKEINPAIVNGQIVGGVAQGIGGALLEEFRYDDLAQPLTSTLADYLLPSAHDVPQIGNRHIEVATPGNPLSVRGVGESGTIAGYAVIACAVEDALDLALTIDEVPVSPVLLATALRSAQRAEAVS